MAHSQQPQIPTGEGQEVVGAQALADLNISWQSESVDLDVLFDSLGADASTTSQNSGQKSGDESGMIVGEGAVPLPVSLDSLESLDDADLTAIGSQIIVDQS